MKKKLRDLTQFDSGMSPKKRKSEKEKEKSHDGTMKSVKNELLEKTAKTKGPTHRLGLTHKKQETFDEEKVKRLDTI